MATIYDCSDNAGLLTGMRLARTAISRGELVVLPTDTVYGIAADAFDPKAVQRLLDAKGRTRQAPPPVLIPNADTLDALAEEVPALVRALVAEFWPGGLTVILPARSSLAWDLGDTGGTVALRMPSNRVALELLSETGPLAVSSANLSGQPAAMTAAGAEGMLGDSVSVYLDDGEAGADYPGAGVGVGSTIIDATALLRPGGELTVVREGVISAAAVNAVVDRVKQEQAAGAAAAAAESAPDAAGDGSDNAARAATDGRTVGATDASADAPPVAATNTGPDAPAQTSADAAGSVFFHSRQPFPDEIAEPVPVPVPTPAPTSDSAPTPSPAPDRAPEPNPSPTPSPAVSESASAPESRPAGESTPAPGSATAPESAPAPGSTLPRPDRGRFVPPGQTPS